MATISTAVGTERISRVSGYKIKKGFFSNETTNLPQLIAVFGEANAANQVGLTTDKVEITSAQEAAELFGYGSPIHQQMMDQQSLNEMMRNQLILMMPLCHALSNIVQHDCVFIVFLWCIKSGHFIC